MHSGTEDSKRDRNSHGDATCSAALSVMPKSAGCFSCHSTAPRWGVHLDTPGGDRGQRAARAVGVLRDRRSAFVLMRIASSPHDDQHDDTAELVSPQTGKEQTR